MTAQNVRLPLDNAGLFRSITILAMAAILFCGCSGRREVRALQRLIDEPVIPPSFVSGPAGVLLTNTTGFSARLTLEMPGLSNDVKTISGQLLGQGSQLMFAPAGGDKTFIWDVSKHTGWVLSEALQGYAPVSISIQITNVANVSEIAGPAGEQANGHHGHEVEVAVGTDDGSVSKFTIWRAADLNGFPVRIKMMNAAGQPVINLSEVRMEPLSPKLFAPPDGFTQYSSPEAMSGELIMRRSKFKSDSNRGQKLDEPFAMPAPTPRTY